MEYGHQELLRKVGKSQTPFSQGTPNLTPKEKGV